MDMFRSLTHDLPYWMCDKSNTTSASSEVGTAYHSGGPFSSLVFSEVRVYKVFSIVL
jgi:hypothetical protein